MITTIKCKQIKCDLCFSVYEYLPVNYNDADIRKSIEVDGWFHTSYGADLCPSCHQYRLQYLIDHPEETGSFYQPHYDESL